MIDFNKILRLMKLGQTDKLLFTDNGEDYILLKFAAYERLLLNGQLTEATENTEAVNKQLDKMRLELGTAVEQADVATGPEQLTEAWIEQEIVANQLPTKIEPKISQSQFGVHYFEESV